MACCEDGLSYESSQWGGGHGQFTYYFVREGMKTGSADAYNQLPSLAGVTIEEAFDYAKTH